ncbi:MAG: hypothetical protein V7K27_18710 [Nostoc sp.]|uniref:hypothetical protein n=1 Tax=Nostoc sp. TaxID=1180 RepID=UPI002FFC66A9
MHSERLRLKTCGRAAIEEHFQLLAGNEILKGFWLKLTPMSSAVPLRQMWFNASNEAQNPFWILAPEF